MNFSYFKYLIFSILIGIISGMYGIEFNEIIPFIIGAFMVALSLVSLIITIEED